MPVSSDDVPPRRTRAERLLTFFPVEFERDSYPNAGPIAVGFRVLLVTAVLCVSIAAVHHQLKPRLVGHYHLQRFALWYVMSGIVAAALPRARLGLLGLGLVVFAALAELVRASPQPFTINLRENIYADVGGIYALLFPFALARWRSAVLPPGIAPPRR